MLSFLLALSLLPVPAPAADGEVSLISSDSGIAGRVDERETEETTVVTTYAVCIEESIHGKVEADKETAAPGELVTLTVYPDTHYLLDELMVSQGETSVTVNETVSAFFMPEGDVTVTATFKETPWFALQNAIDDAHHIGGLGGMGGFIPPEDRYKIQLVKPGDEVTDFEDSSVHLVYTDETGRITPGPGEGTLLIREESVTLDLNGCTIGDNQLTEPVFAIRDGGHLTLQDSNETGGGTITTNGKNAVEVGETGEGNFTLEGGTLTSLEVAVKLIENSAFTMSGGVISAPVIGVWSVGICSIKLTGGSITGCQEGVKSVSAKSVTISGSPVIEGNIKGKVKMDLCLRRDGTMSVTGPMEEGARVGISLDSPGAFAHGEKYTLTPADAACFLSDDGRYTVRLNEETNELEMVNAPSTGLPPDSGEIYSVNALDEDTHEYLKGATIAIIEKETGTAIDEWVSGDGPHESRVLEKGTVYILRVLDAPEGYKKPDDNEFMINETEWEGITILSGPVELTDYGLGLYFKQKPQGRPPQETCTVTFDVNTHGRKMEDVTVNAGEPVSRPEDPTATGYRFDGWYTELECVNAWDFAAPVTGDLVLYAKWTERPSGGGGGGGSVTYAVNVEKAENGTVTASPSYAAHGKTVSLTVKPDEGYQLDGLTVTDVNGKEIPVEQNADGIWSFTMPVEAVTVTPAFVKEEAPVVPDEPGDVSDRFKDVSRGAWYHDAVQWAVDNGIMNGVSDDKFDPDDNTTRAMVVTMLWRMAGEPASIAAAPFTDVKAGSWYADAVNWAAETGAVKGTSETTFSPDTPVTREQLAAILYRSAQSKGLGFTGAWSFPLDFPDAAEVSEYADEAMHWMTMHGDITGMKDGTLAPKANATRAQIATMFMRFCEALEE